MLTCDLFAATNLIVLFVTSVIFSFNVSHCDAVPSLLGGHPKLFPFSVPEFVASQLEICVSTYDCVGINVIQLLFFLSVGTVGYAI